MVQFNPADQPRKFGLNNDETYLTAFGFAIGSNLHSKGRVIFNMARRALLEERPYINAAELTHQIVWMPDESRDDVVNALRSALTAEDGVVAPLLDPVNSYRPDSMMIRTAHLWQEIGESAIQQIGDTAV